MKTEGKLFTALRNSALYLEYERAFNDATGLPVALRPAESWQLPLHGCRNENPFCALMAAKSKSCAACLQVQQQLTESQDGAPQSVTCPAGLCDVAIPVKMGEKLIGFLQSGQVFKTPPDDRQFDHTAKLAAQWGIETDVKRLRQAYFAGRVLNGPQLDATIALLKIFAQHLSIVGNQFVMQSANAEPPFIKRSREFIEANHAQELSLGQVAKAVHASSFYFCKMFKKFTGLNFTDYVSRVRIEKAKNLLLNPNLRVSEIAYEVGFQSLTHFNRVFKRVTGMAPTEYRGQLPSSA
jgi:AraC-like DNA-binding protein/ligand-binding sensor protein